MRALLLASMVAVSAAVPSWLQGEWTRDWIQRSTGRTNTLDVHYLKTPTYFADIRIPRDRAGLAGVRSFSELTPAQLELLATQNGLSGLTFLF